jgi:hypothetical protein
MQEYYILYGVTDWIPGNGNLQQTRSVCYHVRHVQYLVSTVSPERMDAHARPTHLATAWPQTMRREVALMQRI